MAVADSRFRCLRNASPLLRPCPRRRATQQAALRRSENFPSLSEPHDDRQNVDGCESGSACPFSQSRDDRDGRSFAAAAEAARTDQKVRSEAGTRKSPAERGRVAEESRLRRADSLMVTRTAAPAGRRSAFGGDGKTPGHVSPD